MTVARLASSVSVDRIYQALYFQALHEFFRAGRHLMKKGDIIALPLDLDHAQWALVAQTEEGREDEILEPETRYVTGCQAGC